MNVNNEADSLGIRKYFLKKNLSKDLPASLVVFLVALPLCLGIALASGAPLFAGLITGIIGGIVTASLSGSQLSVSGPAAGLTVIVLGAISSLGSYPVFLAAVVMAGLIQIVLGLIKAGTIGNFFPSAVIEGMLAGIGVILILKQLPHAVGYDKDFEGDDSFTQMDHENTFTALISAFDQISLAATIIAAVSVLILIFWPKIKRLAGIPSALVVVVFGIFTAYLFEGGAFALAPEHRVQIPIVASASAFFDLLIFPDFSKVFSSGQFWTVAFTIAIVASLETLLSLEAVDKIDPIKRVSPTNRELIAQGIGNGVAGMLGGLPMTAVIVRSSANVNAGGRTKMSAIFHGIWILLSLLLFPWIINMIPLSCLAAILIMTGYKLAKPSLFRRFYKLGWSQFIPFFITLLAVVFTDLLKGVGIGMVIGVFYILRNNMRNPYFFQLEKGVDGENVHTLRLAEEVSFLNKGAIQYALTHLPAGVKLIVDGSRSRYIDYDVMEVLHNFKANAYTKKIEVEFRDIKDSYTVPKLKHMLE